MNSKIKLLVREMIARVDVMTEVHSWDKPESFHNAVKKDLDCLTRDLNALRDELNKEIKKKINREFSNRFI